MDQPGFLKRIANKQADLVSDYRLYNLTRQITNNVKPKPENPTVAFFVASTRITGISLNAAFTFLAASGLQVSEVPVVYFACKSGMSRCVMGTNRDDLSQPPPCQACIAQSRRLFAHAPTIDFTYQQDESVKKILDELPISELSQFTYPATAEMGIPGAVPLGALVLPSIRWITRLHNLPESNNIRSLFREFRLASSEGVFRFS